MLGFRRWPGVALPRGERRGTFVSRCEGRSHPQCRPALGAEASYDRESSMRLRRCSALLAGERSRNAVLPPGALRKGILGSSCGTLFHRRVASRALSISHRLFLGSHATPQAGPRMASGVSGSWADTACGRYLVLQALISQTPCAATDFRRAQGIIRNIVLGLIASGIFGGGCHRLGSLLAHSAMTRSH